MKARHGWIMVLVTAGILAAMVGCSGPSGNSGEVAEELQGIQATLTAIRAQLAQNRARIEALERSVVASEASSRVSTTTSQDVDAPLVAAIQEGLTNLSARVAEMEIFLSEVSARMRQIPAGAGQRPGS